MANTLKTVWVYYIGDIAATVYSNVSDIQILTEHSLIKLILEPYQRIVYINKDQITRMETLEV
jgi:hypothetical protein